MQLQKISLFCLLVLLVFGTGTDAKILFSSKQNGIKGIYVMDDDGNNQTLIREEGHHNYPGNANWSPDGRLIAFKGILNGYGAYVMHSDGTNVQKLPIFKAYIGRMSFSPDSKSFVFDMRVEIDGKDKKTVNVVNIETGELKEIAEISAISCDWSPDGELIVFAEPGVVGNDKGGTIWVMGSDGHNPRQLMPPPVRGRYKGARWSPDGKQIAYLYDDYAWEPRAKGGLSLVSKAHRYRICDRNGKNIKQLRIPKDWKPLAIDWMDDGESVVFNAYAGIPLNDPDWEPEQLPPCNIYKYHIWTGEITRLTDHPGLDITVDWISDDVLSVSPKDKKKVVWGKVKQQGSE